jgi:FMN phosphatase YigB (HAD superfamily)
MGIILLDIGNVVVSVDFGPFCTAVSRYGQESAGTILGRYCEGELKDRLDTGMIAPGEFLRQLAGDPLVTDMALPELRAAWQNIFSLQPGCIQGVKSLQERHSVWIMSDTDPLHFAFLINFFPVLRSADRYFLSYEHGFLKRSVSAFDHVLGSTGVEPGEFILIDDRAVNCAACEAAGIKSILFSSWEETLVSPVLDGLQGSWPQTQGG